MQEKRLEVVMVVEEGRPKVKEDLSGKKVVYHNCNLTHDTFKKKC